MKRIDGWIAGCKVCAFDWIDGKTIYLNMEYYTPGSSLGRPPAKERTYFITKNDAAEYRLENFLHSIVENLMFRKDYPNNALITFE